MVKKRLKIIWDKEALWQLKDIYNYIKKDSVLAANKVRQEIRIYIENLPQHPLMYKTDIFKENNARFLSCI